jgi:3-dehydroquinate dehydratase-2
MRILLIHGPNLNRLGARNPEIYGTMSLEGLAQAVARRARELGAEVKSFQSNHEGVLIDWLQAEGPQADAVVINPGGLAHYSVALRDALEDCGRPVVEVHLSDPSTRELFRHPLVTATAAARVIKGKGLDGYLEALTWLLTPRDGAS